MERKERADMLTEDPEPRQQGEGNGDVSSHAVPSLRVMGKAAVAMVTGPPNMENFEIYHRVLLLVGDSTSG